MNTVLSRIRFTPLNPTILVPEDLLEFVLYAKEVTRQPTARVPLSLRLGTDQFQIGIRVCTVASPQFGVGECVVVVDWLGGSVVMGAMWPKALIL